MEEDGYNFDEEARKLFKFTELVLERSKHNNEYERALLESKFRENYKSDFYNIKNLLINRMDLIPLDVMSNYVTEYSALKNINFKKECSMKDEVQTLNVPRTKNDHIIISTKDFKNTLKESSPNSTMAVSSQKVDQRDIRTKQKKTHVDTEEKQRKPLDGSFKDDAMLAESIIDDRKDINIIKLNAFLPESNILSNDPNNKQEKQAISTNGKMTPSATENSDISSISKDFTNRKDKIESVKMNSPKKDNSKVVDSLKAIQNNKEKETVNCLNDNSNKADFIHKNSTVSVNNSSSIQSTQLQPNITKDVTSNLEEQTSSIISYSISSPPEKQSQSDQVKDNENPIFGTSTVPKPISEGHKVHLDAPYNKAYSSAYKQGETSEQQLLNKSFDILSNSSQHQLTNTSIHSFSEPVNEQLPNSGSNNEFRSFKPSIENIISRPSKVLNTGKSTIATSVAAQDTGSLQVQDSKKEKASNQLPENGQRKEISNPCPVTNLPRSSEPLEVTQENKEIETPKASQLSKNLETFQATETPKVTQGSRDTEMHEVSQSVPQAIGLPKTTKLLKDIETSRVAQPLKSVEISKSLGTSKSAEVSRAIRAHKVTKKLKAIRKSKALQQPKSSHTYQRNQLLETIPIPNTTNLHETTKATPATKASTTKKENPTPINLLTVKQSSIDVASGANTNNAGTTTSGEVKILQQLMNIADNKLNLSDETRAQGKADKIEKNNGINFPIYNFNNYSKQNLESQSSKQMEHMDTPKHLFPTHANQSLESSGSSTNIKQIKKLYSLQVHLNLK
ncbi:hypothetical protein TPHA_0C00640 [Tetrapisispora phaffii CBS 4417]|uniref:Uncharacterized protein n=1 Tax=Tetrapisispora phaffii (strain ATCC 24235 / CBS 4417 / NBRC 1672 / NRRL Y-8282 / UCD 70-5) TaxID=1071381 RepID=G8BR45_TETPH|nr:hypothetical protein TPHA_0C00640 [Tetrapisispora phaffii CBS 4417]CCE62221.1 hypothetical protein TPHA_0C00640 [Tetrapisispora phaffii CBS 4417]